MPGCTGLFYRTVITTLIASLGLFLPAGAQDISVEDAVEVRLSADRYGRLEHDALEMVDGGTFSALEFDDFFKPSTWEFRLIETLVLDASVGASDVIVNADFAGLTVGGESPSVRYLADSDDNGTTANHIWYENSIIGTPTDWRMMQLTEAAGGTLNVDGPVNANHNFDLAETFWEAEPIEPGELVAIDPLRPDAVLRASEAGQRTLLGVASTSPGFVLGGGAFSLDDLRATWGDEIALEYQQLRPELEARVYGELPELAAEAERVASLGSFEADLEHRIAERTARAGEEGPPPTAPSTPERLLAAYEVARYHHETTMFDRTLRIFFAERFSAVALAGRVPVKVDAGFGAIRPGDFLTSSPTAGVAMRATEPGIVIGTALEALDAGRGTIQVLVDRGWFGGEGLSVGGAWPAATATTSPQIDDLRRRLAALEERLTYATR